MPDCEALREPHAALVRAALEALSPVGAAVALDLACGAGATTSWLAAQARPDAVTLGLDCDRAALRSAQARLPTIQFIGADVQRLPLRAATADLIWCVAALGLFVDPVGALAEMRRILRPGGALVVVSATLAWVRPRHWPLALRASLSSRLSLPPADDLGADLSEQLHAAGLRDVALCAYLLDPPIQDRLTAMLPLVSWDALAPFAADLDPATRAACMELATIEPEPELLPVLLAASGWA